MKDLVLLPIKHVRIQSACMIKDYPLQVEEINNSANQKSGKFLLKNNELLLIESRGESSKIKQELRTED